MKSLLRILFVLGALLSVIPAAAQTDTIALPDSIWSSTDSVAWVSKVPAYCEGPAYEAATGYVYFTRQIGNSTANWPIMRVKPGVDSAVVWYNAKQNNGLFFDPQNRLVTCQNGQLSRLVPNSTDGLGMLDSVLTTFTSTTQSNDLYIGRAGDIYFSGYNDGKVYYLNTQRVLSTVATGVSSSNGIEWLQCLDSNAVYVNGSGSSIVYRYERDPATGALSNRTSFITGVQADGGTFDSHGNRYVASYGNGEIRVYNNGGTYLGRIALRKQKGVYDSVASSGRTGKQGNADNCLFGGPDMKTLYITGDGGLFSIPLKIPGVSQGSGPVSIWAHDSPASSTTRKIPGEVKVLREPRDALGRSLDPALPGAKMKTVRSVSVPNHAD